MIGPHGCSWWVPRDSRIGKRGTPFSLPSASMSQSVVIRLRRAAFSEQNGRCFYCDSPMWLDDVAEFAARHHLSIRQARWLQATAEHLVARCEGGTHAGNIAAACRWCNWMRHRQRVPSAVPNPAAFRCFVMHRLTQGRWRPFSAAVACPERGKGI